MTWPLGETGPLPPSSEPPGTSSSGSTVSVPPGEHRRSGTEVRWRALAAVGGGAAALLGVLLALWLSNGRLNDRVDRLETASSSRGQALDVACRQVAALGGQCAGATAPPDKPEQPVPVPTAVPPAQVDYDRIVREAVAQVRAVVPRGPAGRPGPAPTPAQIQTAVSRVCAGARCGPSQGAIAAAVAAYFSANPPPSGPPGQPGADGAEGPQGPAGEPGAVGRGIASIDVADCRMTVTYTDGTTAGPFDVCAPSPSPSPSPSGSPSLPGLPLPS
jgi:hypothetical protein